MNTWTVVLLAGLGSYLLRVSMVVAADRIRLPERLNRAGRLVAPSVFAALAAGGIAEAALAPHGSGMLAPLIAAGVALLAAVRTGSPNVAILAGLPTLWILAAMA